MRVYYILFQTKKTMFFGIKNMVWIRLDVSDDLILAIRTSTTIRTFIARTHDRNILDTKIQSLYDYYMIIRSEIKTFLFFYSQDSYGQILL